MSSRNYYQFFYLLIAASWVVGQHAVHKMKVGKVFGNFEWKNCYETALPMNVSSFSIQPDPVKPGSIITASFVLDVSKDIGTTNSLRADFELVLTIQGTRIDLCSYRPYSEFCHIENVCKVLAQQRKKCEFIKKLGADCKCPLRKKTYSVKNIIYQIPYVPVEGMFHVKANLTESDHVMGCLEVDVCIGSC